MFAEKGYHHAGIRDIAATTGVSISGLYYYFRSKEELLFLIQDHCFGTILERLRQDLEGKSQPEAMLRILIRNHLRFFAGNMDEMKVLSVEADALSGEYARKVTDLKREYARTAGEILERLREEAPDGGSIDPRVATFSLFGMLNWIYTWYRPETDVPVHRLADEMTHIFLEGFRTPRVAHPESEEVAESNDDPSIWRTP